MRLQPLVLATAACLVLGCGKSSSSATAPTPAPPPLQTIAELTTQGINSGPVAPGQSVTVTGGSFNNLRFRFLVPDGGEPANGSLFLLDREYTGTPVALSATTPGFVASTSRLEDGEWIFDATVRLTSGVTYWFMANSRMRIFTTVASTTDLYIGGDVYTAGLETVPFIRFIPFPGARTDAYFRLRGSVAP